MRELLVELLAYFAAQRNYGYIDKLGNALDEITAYEALKDALRDYNSVCVDRRQECCPNIDPARLEMAVKNFIESISGKSGDVIVKETRKLSLEVLARRVAIVEMLAKCEGGR